MEWTLLRDDRLAPGGSMGEVQYVRRFASWHRARRGAAPQRLMDDLVKGDSMADGPQDLNREFVSSQPDDGPLVMVNLVRFRARSLDGNASGWDAYTRYKGADMTLLKRVGGTILRSPRVRGTPAGLVAEPEPITDGLDDLVGGRRDVGRAFSSSDATVGSTPRAPPFVPGRERASSGWAKWCRRLERPVDQMGFRKAEL